MDVPVAVLFGIVSMFGYGISNALAKRGSELAGPVRFFFYREAFTVLALFISVALFASGSFSIAYLPVMLFIAFIGYMAVISFYKGLQVGKVGIVSPIGNSCLVFTVLLSVVFFGEFLNPIQALSIAGILAGVVLISLNISDLRSSSKKLAAGVPFALVTMVLWGLFFFLLKIPVNLMGPILTSFLAEFLVFAFAGIHNIRNIRRPGKNNLLIALLVGVTAALGTLFFNLGISLEQVSLVAPITFANPLVAVGMARVLYGEKLRTIQYLSALLIVAGIVVLAT